MVLVPAHAPRGSLCLQGVRFAERRPRTVDRTYRFRGSDHAAERASAREHRNPHDGVFLKPDIIRPLIPAQAGIQIIFPKCWVPAFAGTSGMCGELPLRELEAAASFGAAVFLALDHTTVAG